ncbi:MAG: oligosaccharide flippase family protein [Pseudomonadota bacterium]
MTKSPRPSNGALGPLRHWFQDGPLGKIFKNAGVLLSARTLAGICAFGYLALSARGLGPELFGLLVLVQTFVQTVSGLAKFQSWQALIHYGAAHLEAERRSDLQGLIKFTVLLDLASALIGCLVALVIVPLIGPALEWSERTQSLAQLYSLLILVTITATPTGILRLFDRFDLLAAQSLVMPALRFAGVLVAFLLEAGFTAYLLVWFASGVAQRLTLVALGWRELGRQDLIAGMGLSPRGVVAAHPGIWRFVWATNLSSSLGQVMKRLDVLVVGWILGPAAAGLYKIALEFANVLAAPVVLLRQTVYPELAKLLAQGDTTGVRKVMGRGGLIAGSAALALALVIAAIGHWVIGLTVGPAYEAAYLVMVLLVVARTISVFPFALGPALTAMGAPGMLLRIELFAALGFLPLLILLLRWIGLEGAGIAAIVIAVPAASALVLATLSRLKQKEGP